MNEGEIAKINMDGAMYRTCQPDPNYTAMNQAHYCWQRYNEWVYTTNQTKNKKERNEARLQATCVCPNDWVKMWDEQLENGTFLGVPTKKCLKARKALIAKINEERGIEHHH